MHYDNVLGTSMDITIVGITSEQAEQAVTKTLNEIQRLESILSTWQPNSQINTLNKLGSSETMPNELTQVIKQCEKWWLASNKTFSCRMGKLSQLWLAAEQNQVVPDRVDVRYQARDIQRADITLDSTKNSVVLANNIVLDPSGLAKGFIIDLASTHLLKQLPNAKGLKLDIGGDANYWGQGENNSHWQVGITDANQVNDAQQNNLAHINLSGMAIASSGHNSRYREIQRRKFSHIINPQDGWPMDNAPSATVVAKNATTADAIATALSTQPVAKGIDWVNTLDDVEALITLPDGIKVMSAGWHNLINQNTSTNVTAEKNSIKIDYQIPNIEATNYNKPYVAIWISDRKNRNVRNLLLLGESNRWAKENTRWWRRVGRKNEQLLDGIARPTRKPGQYNLIWNGLNDFGGFEETTQFYLHVEASREGGGHNYQRIPFEFNPESYSDNDQDKLQTKNINLPTKGEIGEIHISYKNTELANNTIAVTSH